MNPVAKRIQALLDQRGEKLKPAAEAAGLTYYSIYPWWQRENSKADLEKVRALAKYFGVPEGHLAYGDPISGDRDEVEALAQRIETLPEDLQNDLRSYLEFLEAKKPR